MANTIIGGSGGGGGGSWTPTVPTVPSPSEIRDRLQDAAPTGGSSSGDSSSDDSTNDSTNDSSPTSGTDGVGRSILDPDTQRQAAIFANLGVEGSTARDVVATVTRFPERARNQMEQFAERNAIFDANNTFPGEQDGVDPDPLTDRVGQLLSSIWSAVTSPVVLVGAALLAALALVADDDATASGGR